MTVPNLFTFGYEGLDIAGFIDGLHAASVRMVIDVRELPLSRKKGFSKTSFSQELAAQGIAYCHLPALGCPKPVRDRFRSDGDWPRYVRDFEVHLAKQQAAMEYLIRLARAAAACLVCFEADYSMCHRSYVARAAHSAGAPAIKHLRAKTKRPDQDLRMAA